MRFTIPFGNNEQDVYITCFGHEDISADAHWGKGSRNVCILHYILSGKGKLTLGEKIIDVYADQVIFIPAGCFHALDNSESDTDLKILTFWRDYRFNEAYAERVRQWGTSFKTIDEE